MKTLKLSLLLMLSPFAATAEDIAAIPRYMEMKVLSCSAVMPLLEQKIKAKNYSAAELENTRISAQYVSMIEAIPLRETEYISAYFEGSISNFKGRVKTLGQAGKRQFVLPGVDIDSCKKTYADGIRLFYIIENFQCHSDIKPDGLKSTVAQCLTGLPMANRMTVSLDDLPPLTKKR